MGTKVTSRQFGDQLLKTGDAVRSNEFVRRLIEDPSLRETVLDAFQSSRSAVRRASDSKKPSDLLQDKRLQKELRQASASLQEIKQALVARPKRPRRGRKLLAAALIGAGVALAMNEGLRDKALSTLFGAEEEFEYSSTTTNGTSATAEPTQS